MGEALSASRPLVREALQGLAWLGAIETRRGSGSVVAQDGRNVLRQSFEVMLLLDSTRIEDLFEVREMLEVPAAGLAAERRTPEDLARIREILTEMDTCLEDNQRLATLNRQFHLAIARAARNLVLERILDVVLEARGTYLAARCQSPQAWPEWGVSHDTHHSIVDAISAECSRGPAGHDYGHGNGGEILELCHRVSAGAYDGFVRTLGDRGSRPDFRPLAALAAHLKTPHFQEASAAIGDLADGAPDIRVLIALGN